MTETRTTTGQGNLGQSAPTIKVEDHLYDPSHEEIPNHITPSYAERAVEPPSVEVEARMYGVSKPTRKRRRAQIINE